MEAKQLQQEQQFYHQDRESQSHTHSPAYQALLRAGPRVRPLKQVHAQIVVFGKYKNLALLTKLLTLACAAGSIAYTRRLFLTVPNPDSFLFNTLIKGSSKFGFSNDAVFFYRRMLLANISPSNYTFTSVIKACADLSASRLGRGIHSHVLVCGYGSDSFVQAALVTFYAKTGDLEVARRLFDKMPDRTVVAWNSMISGYEQNGFSKEAIGLFNQMREWGVKPD